MEIVTGQAHRGFEGAYVHLPRALNVRYSRKNLCDSVSYRYYELALREMLESGTSTAPNVLQTAVLTGAADQRYASFGFGEELLNLSTNGLQQQHLAQLLHKRRDSHGLQAAQQRFGTLRASFFSASRLKSIARVIAAQVFHDLQALAPNSVASLQNHLERNSTELSERSESIGREVATIQARLSHLQNALSAAPSRIQPEASPGDEVKAEGSGRWGWMTRLKTSVSQVISKYAANPFKSNVSDSSATTHSSDNRQGLSDPIEREVLDVELRLAVRNAEWQVLRGVVELLTFESEKNRQILDVLHRSQQNALPQAAQYERTRDYGIAGGELLLNSEALTRAVMKHAFGNDSATQQRWRDTFRNACTKRLNDKDAELDDTVAQKMYDAIHAEVSKRLGGFTVVDAIVSIHEDNPNFVARLRGTFEGVAKSDFLSSGYERYLDLQRFATVSYVASEIPEVSSNFLMVLEGILQSVHVDAQITQVETEPEVLRFSVVDYVPVIALKFYDEGLPAFTARQGDPRYRIYPELAKKSHA